ncbi:MAG: RNA polymerase factor sigma-54 [Burkholderiaceae bacterium]|jgi:RNA polymerase sigma-54 factor
MRTSLQLKVSQHLTLTPQLQQSIRLLQLSTLELQQELDQVVQDNPLLERVDEPPMTRLSGDLVLPSHTATAHHHEDDTPRVQTTAEAAADPPSEASGDAWESSDWNGTDGSENFRVGAPEDDKPGFQLAAINSGLKAHLLEQLGALRCSDCDRGLVRLLIDALDDNGYLSSDLAELHAVVPKSLDIQLDELETALHLLQSFDPPGVGARTPAECLQLQLRARIPVGHPDYALASRIIADHLDLLALREYGKLKKLLHTTDDRLRSAHALICELDPFPGLRHQTETDPYVVADILVKKQHDRWVAMLNPEIMPCLRVNERYAQILRRQRGRDSSALAGQLQEARWLVKNIQQRFDTILRVGQAIVERQQRFFNHGEIAMQPLVLRQIAEELGLHESTISRVTTQKFMLTPGGVFELKYFFGSHVATDTGGSASSTAIRALLKQLVSTEDPHRPLTDGQIAELLARQGLVVARRTVAKYRESLRIAPVSLRKTL